MSSSTGKNMLSAQLLRDLKDRLGLTMYGLNKRLGLKSNSHVWLLINGDRSPDIDTSKKIIAFGKKMGIPITWQMIHGEDTDA